MSTLNIGGNQSDRFYRYKMPKLISKVEGKGNGIKTVVPNMSDIARSLSRPPTYPTKFFGCELGAQVKFDEPHDRYIVNGNHDAAKLQELLHLFIKKFVLCAGCSNPETDLVIKGKGANQKIIRDCKACGQFTDVDMRHKLVTFILKNPPVNPKSSKLTKKERRAKKNGEETDPSLPSSSTRGSSEEGSDDELYRRIQAEASELPVADQKDDDEWAQETSSDAVAERVKELEEGIRTTLITKENQTAVNNDIYKKIKELGIDKENDIENDKIIKQLVLSLFAESFKTSTTIGKHINKRKKLFQKLIKDADGQRALLGGTEILVGVKCKELFDIKTICRILMEYYRADLLEEDVFVVWFEGKNTEKYKKLFKRTFNIDYVTPQINEDIRNKSKSFAKWLKEADEEDDDDDE
ncbi:15842_t:CDS:2 [Entrophospora sp. SA101]|nr:8374_t:CDS:2 [Entrophospora sp. SA101]CAJ0631743.1 15842_t:CDS:2 [Entrophospora sp. SA101]